MQPGCQVFNSLAPDFDCFATCEVNPRLPAWHARQAETRIAAFTLQQRVGGKKAG
jgi:hypothetical protein